MCGQTQQVDQNSVPMEIFVSKKCGNCNADADETHRCSSCCNMVCTTCMTNEDLCCISCQELFPASPHQSSVEFDSPASDNDACVQFHVVLVPTEQGIPNSDLDVKCIEYLCDEGEQNNGPSTSQDMHSLWLSAQAAELDRQAERLIAEARCARISAAAAQAAQQAGFHGQPQHYKVNRCREAKTMMICDIPCRINRETLVEAINAIGFSGTYDFVHLPCRYGHENTNIGYGFVNFFDATVAESFAVAFQGYTFHGYKSAKKCSVKVAKHQGFNANLFTARSRKKMALLAN